MSRLIERIIPLLMGLLLLTVAGYQLFLYGNRQLDTDTIYEYTVSRTIEARGVAIRDEMALDQAATGMEYYLFADAERVAVGETMIELRTGKRAAAEDFNRTRELRQSIDQLQQAQNTPVDYAGAEIYNRDIKQRLSELSIMSSTGRYQDLQTLRQNLLININRKHVSTGKVLNFSPQISRLNEELQNSEQTRTGSIGGSITAPSVGYFSRGVDGYESRLTAESIAKFTLDDYTRLIESGAPPLAGQRAGKLVHSNNWIFAAPVPSYQMEWINEELTRLRKLNAKLQIKVQFDEMVEPIGATVTGALEEKNKDTAILFLECNDLNEDLINLRVADAKLQFQEKTGLRINTEDLRFRTNPDGSIDRGVYIRSNNKVYFRLVDPVYEEESFLLSRPYYSAEEYLEPQRQARQLDANEEVQDPPDLTLEEEEASRKEDTQQPSDGSNTQNEYKRYVILFDQVITKGKNLHDGKTIKEF